MEFPEHFCIVFDYPLSNLFSSSKVSNISKQEISFRYADQLTIEDELLIDQNDGLTYAKILDISSFTMQGDQLSFDDEFYLIAI